MANKNLISGFGLKLPDKDELKLRLKKVKEEKKVIQRKPTSSKLSLPEKLNLIKEQVLLQLGKYQNTTKVIYKEEDFIEYINHSIRNGVISIDTETNNSIDPITCKILGLCLYTPNDYQVYVPINHTNFETGERLNNQLDEDFVKEYLSKLTDTKIIMHNAKFDIQVIDFTCFQGQTNSLKCYWDTMLAAKILDENNSAKLKDLYKRFIDYNQESYSIETFFKGIKYEHVDPEIFALYAATDSYMTYELYRYQIKQFQEIKDENLYKVFKEVEMGVLPVVVQMQETGLGLDFKYIKNLSESYNKKLNIAKEKIDSIIAQYQNQIDDYKLKNPNHKLSDPILITSPSQLAVLLYDILKLKSPDPEKPRATGEPELKKLNHPLVKPILEFREFNKLVTTYIDKLPKDVNPKTKKIHANFNQIGVEDNTVVTGRFSSSDPNLYNWRLKLAIA